MTTTPEPAVSPAPDTDDVSVLLAAAEHARRALPPLLGETAARWLTAEADCHASADEVGQAAADLVNTLDGDPSDTAGFRVVVSTLPSAVAFARQVLALHWQHHRALLDAEQARGWANTLQKHNAELREQLPYGTTRDREDKQRDQEVVEAIVQGLGGHGHNGMVGDWDTEVSVEDVVAALKDLGQSRRERDRITAEVGRKLDVLRRVRRGVDDVLARFDTPSGVSQEGGKP